MCYKYVSDYWIIYMYNIFLNYIKTYAFNNTKLLSYPIVSFMENYILNLKTLKYATHK